MDEPTETTVKIPTDEFTIARCIKCGCETRHKVLAEATVHYSAADGYVNTWLTYQIPQCQGCMTASFRTERRCSEDTDYDYNGNEFFNVTSVSYPNPEAGRSEMDEVHHLPSGVAAIYREAIAAFSSQQLPISAGFALRAIIEAVCIDKAIRAPTLEKRIDSLGASALITPAAVTILHSLRFMGNAAAHEMKAHSTAELKAALDVVEILLQNVYVLPQLAQALPKSNSTKQQTP